LAERVKMEEERERLLEAEHEQRLRAETLAEVVLALTSQTSIDAVLDEILRQAQRLVPSDAANIALLEGDTLHTVRSHGYEAFGSGEAISHLAHPLAALPLALEAIRSLKPIGVPDTRKEPLWTQEEDFAWIRSHIMMPICLHDRALGVLRLDSDRPGQYGAEDAERLQPLVNAIAIALETARLQPLVNAAAMALENARLYDQVRQELAERVKMEEERERLLEAEHEQHLRAETLAEVVLALTSQVGIEAVLDEILRQAQRLVSSGAANIALLEGDILHTVRWQGYEAFGSDEAISHLAHPLAAFPLAIKAIRSQKPLAIQDAHAEPLWTREGDFAWIRSHIVMPICLRDRLLGVIRLDSDMPGQFRIEDAERLQPLVNAAAVALEGARLYDQVRQELIERKQAATEREKLIAELQEALVQVRRLSGLLPICASCKKIRDDKGYWQQVEVYIHDHAGVEFSHGICPDCKEKLYPRAKYPYLYIEP